MSRNTPANPVVAIVIAIAVVTCFGISGAAYVSTALPESQNPAAIVAQFFAFLGIVIAALGTLAGLVKVAKDVGEMKNGTMDSKIRAGVADVLPPELVRDDVREQLHVDRAVRARQDKK